MGKSWSDHFNYSLTTTSDTLHIPIPVPSTVAKSFADASATYLALLLALRTTSGAAKTAVYLRDVITMARSAGNLGSYIGAASTEELLKMAGGVVASAYVGALIGAAVYATEQVLVGDWLDKVFGDLADARENAKAAARQSARMGATPVACGQVLQPGDYQTDATCRAPVSACNADSPPAYSSGWPTAPVCY
jgi:hypothetical protein